MNIPTDLSSLDITQVRSLISQATAEVQSTSGMPFLAAFNRVKAMYPSLFAAAAALSPNAPEAVEEAPPAVPQPSFANGEGFCLPPDFTLDEFTAAWKANGNKATPVNHNAILNAMVQLTGQSNNLSAEDGVTATYARFPLLAATVFGQQAAQKIGTGLPDATPMPVKSTPGSIPATGPTQTDRLLTSGAKITRSNFGLSVA